MTIELPKKSLKETEQPFRYNLFGLFNLLLYITLPIKYLGGVILFNKYCYAIIVLTLLSCLCNVCMYNLPPTLPLISYQSLIRKQPGPWAVLLFAKLIYFHKLYIVTSLLTHFHRFTGAVLSD